MKYAYLEEGMLLTSELYPLQNRPILRPAGISQSGRKPKTHTGDLGDLNYTSTNNRNNRSTATHLPPSTKTRYHRKVIGSQLIGEVGINVGGLICSSTGMHARWPVLWRYMTDRSQNPWTRVSVSCTITYQSPIIQCIV
jgi:hypothetical protein